MRLSARGGRGVAAASSAVASAVAAAMTLAVFIAIPVQGQAAAAPARSGAATITVADAVLTHEFCSTTNYVYDADPPEGYPRITVYVTASTPQLSDHAGDRQFSALGSGTLTFCSNVTPGPYQADLMVVACNDDGSDCVEYNAPRTYFQLLPAPPIPAAPVEPLLKARLEVRGRGAHQIALHVRTFLSRKGVHERISARVKLQVHVGKRWLTVAHARTSDAGSYTWRATRPRGLIELRVEAKARGQVKASPSVSGYY